MLTGIALLMISATSAQAAMDAGQIQGIVREVAGALKDKGDFGKEISALRALKPDNNCDEDWSNFLAMGRRVSTTKINGFT